MIGYACTDTNEKIRRLNIIMQEWISNNMQKALSELEKDGVFEQYVLNACEECVSRCKLFESEINELKKENERLKSELKVFKNDGKMKQNGKYV